MKVVTRWLIAAMALATPAFVSAQTPPAPGPDNQGPGMEMRQRMGMGQRGGMGMGMRGKMGMRGGRGMGMRGQAMRRHPGMMLHHMLQNPAVRERLGITPEQMTKLQSHESVMAKSAIRSHADLQVKRMELGELMRADKPDRLLIDKKLREVQDAMFASEKARIDGQLNMHELFTPEQRKEMEKMRSEFRGGMMQRGPDGQGGRMGPGGMGPRGPRPAGPPKPPAQNPPPADNGR